MDFSFREKTFKINTKRKEEREREGGRESLPEAKHESSKKMKDDESSKLERITAKKPRVQRLIFSFDLCKTRKN